MTKGINEKHYRHEEVGASNREYLKNHNYHTAFINLQANTTSSALIISKLIIHVISCCIQKNHLLKNRN